MLNAFLATGTALLRHRLANAFSHPPIFIGCTKKMQMFGILPIVTVAI